MDTLISILAILAGVIGIAGSILPGLPGTPVSWVGLLVRISSTGPGWACMCVGNWQQAHPGQPHTQVCWLVGG